MNAEMRQFIEKARFHQAAITELGGNLPPADVDLDALIAEVVAANDLKTFMFVMAAAAGAERRMDARHLALGAMIFPEHRWLGSVVVRMHGDVPEHLLAAIQNTRLNKECEAAALHLIAAWCQEKRGGVFPERLIPLARALARRLPKDSMQAADLHCLFFLLALALRTSDGGLNTLLRQQYRGVPDARWKSIEEDAQKISERVIVGYRKPVLELAPVKPPNQMAAGITLRRAVPRLGRNEPCPCGSGKKYKHCCFDRDQERLHHSSDVAGLTHEELYAQMEEHLTAARLDRAEPYELARLDPAKIPPALLDAYFLRLTAFNLLDRAVEALETLGWSDAFGEAWENVMFGASRSGRRDVAQRLMRLREPHGFTEADLDICYRLLLADEDPARCLQLIEENARQVLQTENLESLLGLAYGVTFSKFPALGILLYRGVFQLVPADRAAVAFEQLLLARDRLNLPPDDPFSDIIDKRFADDVPDESKDAAELRRAQHSLATKAQEVRELKESLDRLQREIARREKTAVPSTPAAPATPADDRAVKDLREKVEGLKSALKARHNERNTLRRELQKAHGDLESLRQKAAPAAAQVRAGHGADAEEDLLLPQEAAGNQPLRVIEFPRNFQQTLAGVPHHVARGALTMLGRLAAGEPAAFVGAVRLKACPSVTRQRIGIDHRLLFRLTSDRVQVVDLIPRQDLERRIKTLA
jgi:hypothetical protein